VSSPGDLLTGGPGDDFIDCQDFGDELYSDSVSYERAQAQIVADLETGVVTGATTGTDTIASDPAGRFGCEYFTGTRFADTINDPDQRLSRILGLEGADRITGARQWVFGGPGADTIASHADLIDAGPGNDSVQITGVGVAFVHGDEGGDHLVGNAWVVYGDAGSDWLEGSSSYDKLRGGPGDDQVVGGAGFDVAIGGGGTDTCDAERERHCELAPR
jgi:Ca2+-binding RTX toxin-like protein